MHETRQVIYELYNITDDYTINYFDREDELIECMKIVMMKDTNIQLDIITHHSCPDSQTITKEQKIKINRDNLIDNLLNG